MNIKEIWKDIPDYEDYMISNLGRVKSKERLIRYTHSVTKNEHYRKTEEKILNVYSNARTGYKFVQLKCNKKSKNWNIHRLVAIAFIEKNEKFNVVNHIDGNKHNNIVQNLEWCTDEYNHRHAANSGLTAKGIEVKSSILNENCVHAIKYFLNKGYTRAELSKAFNVSRQTIILIAQNKTWQHIALTGEELTIKE